MFGEIWNVHKSLGSSSINSRRQIPRFHTLGFVQGLEANLDEHKITTSMFQQATYYSVQMTNILIRFSDLEISNKQVIEEKDKFIYNLQGGFQERVEIRSKVTGQELQKIRQKINNMEKHDKDLENIIVERDFLQEIMKQTNANYWKLKTKKDALNVEYNKLQRDYMNMEKNLLKQQKELEELKANISIVYQVKNEIQM